MGHPAGSSPGFARFGMTSISIEWASPKKMARRAVEVYPRVGRGNGITFRLKDFEVRSSGSGAEKK